MTRSKLDASEANGMAEEGLTFEVQQQLGDGVVRTIAMGSSDGLRRRMKVNNTGAAISVPVGQGTLGRIMDVLDVQSMKLARSKVANFARTMQLQKFDELSSSVDLLETGIKVIDLICPFAKGWVKLGYSVVRVWARPSI